MSVEENEGHGRLDGSKKGFTLRNIALCRFHFPKFPLDKTTLVNGLSKDAEEEFAKQCKADYKKITKFIVRQTYANDNSGDDTHWDWLKNLDFYEFLYHVGMYHPKKNQKDINDND